MKTNATEFFVMLATMTLPVCFAAGEAEPLGKAQGTFTITFDQFSGAGDNETYLR